MRGSGEPVVLIQTALTADELLPLRGQPGLRDSYTLVLYHRRDYGTSTPVTGAGSIERDAQDCWALLAALLLYVGGSDSGPLCAAVRELVRGWLPRTEDVVLPGADHNLTVAHTAALADVVSDFLRRHPPEAERVPERVPQSGGAR